MTLPNVADPAAQEAADSIVTAAVSGTVPPEIVDDLPQSVPADLDVQLPVPPLGDLPAGPPADPGADAPLGPVGDLPPDAPPDDVPEPGLPQVTLPEPGAAAAPLDAVPPADPPPDTPATDAAAAAQAGPPEGVALAGLEASGTLDAAAGSGLSGLFDAYGTEDSVLSGGGFLTGLLESHLGSDLSGYGYLAAIAAGDLPGVADVAGHDLTGTPPFAGLDGLLPDDASGAPVSLGDVLPDLGGTALDLAAMAPDSLRDGAGAADAATPLDGLPVTDSAPPTVTAPEGGLGALPEGVPPPDPFIDAPPAVVPPDPTEQILADAGMVDPHLPVF